MADPQHLTISQRNLFVELLERVQILNPFQYQRFEDSLRSPKRPQEDLAIMPETSASIQTEISIDSGGGDIATNDARLIKPNGRTNIVGEEINIQGDLNITNS